MSRYTNNPVAPAKLIAGGSQVLEVFHVATVWLADKNVVAFLRFAPPPMIEETIGGHEICECPHGLFFQLGAERGARHFVEFFGARLQMLLDELRRVVCQKLLA